ncbi:MAG: TldD/PmbA family protein [Promethearchaeota archaeon]|nr:MAG: TldD/PmbA family protein [Candidatus Lokiarchaeota archaeon]
MAELDTLKVFDDQLLKQLNQLAVNKIEYWDIKSGIGIGTHLDFTDQKSKEISSYELRECGIRTFTNGGWGFNVIKDLSKESIKKGFINAMKLARLSESLCKNKFKIKERNPLVKNYKGKSKKKIEDISIEDKIDQVKYHEKTACNYSSEVKNSHTIYMDGHSYNLFLNSFGSRIYQELSILRLYSLVYAQKNGILQRAVNSVGGLGGFEIIETDQANELSAKSAQEAIELLDAKSPVGGNFRVIMDPKFCGVLIHEALGHAVEADTVLNKESILEGRIGQVVASEEINIIDDPRMGQGKKFNLPYELFGSYFVDDEGIPSQKTVIIENGILKSYLHDLETSSRMGVSPNGHGRASSSTSRPQVRMGITILEPKDWELDEIIEDTKEGILCEDFQYGYTDPTTGNFQFKCKMSYKIENGEKKDLMRDVALSGLTLEVLKRISAIGKSIGISDGICGKGGQGVRVCDGGPYIRVENVTVGGLS